MEKNYNGVTVLKTWSLVGFAKEFGKLKFAKDQVNKSTGEVFDSLVFDNDGKLTWCHFGYSTQGMTAQDILREKDSLQVGLNSNGKYTLFKPENAWEIIDL